MVGSRLLLSPWLQNLCFRHWILSVTTYSTFPICLPCFQSSVALVLPFPLWTHPSFLIFRRESWGSPGLQAMIGDASICPILALHSEKLRGLRQGGLNNGNTWTDTFGLVLIVCLHLLYNAIASAAVVLFLGGSILGILDAAGILNHCLLFSVLSCNIIIASKQWDWGYQLYMKNMFLSVSIIILFFIYFCLCIRKFDWSCFLQMNDII